MKGKILSWMTVRINAKALQSPYCSMRLILNMNKNKRALSEHLPRKILPSQITKAMELEREKVPVLVLHPSQRGI